LRNAPKQLARGAAKVDLVNLHSLLSGVDWIRLGPIFAVAVAPIVLRWPVESSLGLYAFLVPFDDIALLPSGREDAPTLTKFLGAVAALILVGVGLVERRLTPPPRAALWLILFVGWAGITCLWSLDTQTAYSRLGTAAGLLFVYLSAVCLRVTEKELRTVVWLAILGACAAAGYSLLDFFRGTMSAGRASLILGGEEADADMFSASLLTPVSLALGLLLADRGWLKRWLLMGAMALMAFGIFTTMSRGAFVALIAMFLVYLYHYRMSWRVWVPVGAMAAILSMVPASFFSRLGQSVSTGGGGRLDVWTVGLHALKRYAFAGAGLNCFPYAWEQYWFYAPNYIGHLRASHNIYLGRAVELGIFGLILMITAFVCHIRAARRSSLTAGSESPPPALPSYEAACWAVLVAGFFLDIMWRKAFWLTWMLLAMAVRLREDRRAAMRL
jgi:O-antigen ligase